MPSVEFHSGVRHKTQHAVRLLRKAVAKGARVCVAGESAALRELDAALWTADPRDFVAHVLVSAGRTVAPRLDRTPVWLVEDLASARACPVIVNLGPGVPDGIEAFERVIEVVTSDADDARAGRSRWRHYERLGLSIEHHRIAADEAGTTAPREGEMT